VPYVPSAAPDSSGEALVAGYPLDGADTVSIEGPDHIAIELLTAAPGPAFWR
jgi:hypothetical protein